MRGVDVLFEELAGRGVPVDIDLLDIDALLGQKTSGVLAGGSGRFGVEDRFGHAPSSLDNREIADD
jgi:hypothetical protein